VIKTSEELVSKFGLSISKEKSNSEDHCVDKCPFCGDDRNHFYITKSKITSKAGKTDYFGRCVKCGQSGDLRRLVLRYSKMGWVSPIEEFSVESLRSIAEENVERLYTDEYKHVLDYMIKDRKWELKSLKHKMVGCNKKGHISLPNIESKKVKAIQYKRPWPKEGQTKNYYETLNKKIKAAPPLFYNIDALNLESEDLLVVEGRPDVFAAEAYGFDCVIGIESANAKVITNFFMYGNKIRAFEKFKRIYIIHDADRESSSDQLSKGSDVGFRASFELARKLGLKRCYNVELPEHDLADCLVAEYTSEDIIECLKNAKKFKPVGMKRLSELNKSECVVRPSTETGYSGLTKALGGGWRPGEITLITAHDTNCGKSTFARDVIYQLVKNEKKTVAIYSLEDSREYIAEQYCNILGIKFTPDAMAKNKILRRLIVYGREDINEVRGSSKSAQMQISNFAEHVHETVERYGVEYVLLDDLGFIAEETSSGDDGGYAKQEAMMINALDLVKYEKIHIFAIQQNNKTSNTALYGKFSTSVIKGAQGIASRSKNIIFLYRNVDGKQVIGKERGEEIYCTDPDNILNVYVYKSKFIGFKPRTIRMEWSDKALTYTELEE